MSPWISSATAAPSDDAVRDRERGQRGRRDVRRVAAGADHGDDALAGLEAAAVAFHDARDLRAGRERQLVARQVGVLARVGVGEVDARAGHADEHVVLVGLGRRRVLDQLEDLGARPTR